MTPDVEQFVEIRPCVVDGEPHACTVWFVINGQQFCITSIAMDNRDEAEHFKGMFVTALTALLAQREQAVREACAKEVERARSKCLRVKDYSFDQAMREATAAIRDTGRRA